MKILIIDDDAFIRNFYTTKLQEKGFTVDTAIDGEEGLNKIKQQKPDLVLLDIIMPKKDGFGLLAQLKTDNIIPALPILVFSTLGQEADVEKARLMGAKDYVNKSFFDFDLMLKKILTYLHQ